MSEVMRTLKKTLTRFLVDSKPPVTSLTTTPILTYADSFLSRKNSKRFLKEEAELLADKYPPPLRTVRC